MELVKTFGNRPEAEVARELLEKAGIPCWLKGDDLRSLQPSLAMSGIEIWVNKTSLKDAKEILDTSSGGVSQPKPFEF